MVLKLQCPTKHGLFYLSYKLHNDDKMQYHLFQCFYTSFRAKKKLRVGSEIFKKIRKGGYFDFLFPKGGLGFEGRGIAT